MCIGMCVDLQIAVFNYHSSTKEQELSYLLNIFLLISPIIDTYFR